MMMKLLMRRPAAVLPCLLLALQLAASATLGASAAQLKMEQMQHHATDKDGDGKAEEHDTNFDHEMFLGKEGAEQFTGLQADEAKVKLGSLFDTKIDANKDGKVDKAELIKWMAQVAEDHVKNDVNENWRRLNKTSDSDLLTWPEYAASRLMLPNVEEEFTRAALKVLQSSDPAAIAKSGSVGLAPLPKDASEHAKSLHDGLVSDLLRDSRRWLLADDNNDGKLSKTELHQFLYPDDFPKMRDLLVKESIEHSDRNHDGKVSMEEFVAEMWNPTKGSDEKEPEWVEEERKNFREKKDKNKDGFLDAKEFADYMFDHEHEKSELYNREADHLIAEADANKDGALSRDEIVGNLELFAGSAATNYGDHIGLTDREEL